VKFLVDLSRYLKESRFFPDDQWKRLRPLFFSEWHEYCWTKDKKPGINLASGQIDKGGKEKWS
jgi:hypothetical protein